MSGIPSNPPVWDTTVGITGVVAGNHAADVQYGTAHDPQSPVTYNVYWSETTPINFATAGVINDTGSPTEVPGLDNFKPYYFAVRAVDSVGSEDTNTNQLSATPNGPPEWVGPVGIQSTKPGNGSVTVTYGIATDIDLPIKYNIYWSETTPIDFATASKAVDTDGSPYTVGSLINNKTYYFAVRAEDSTGDEENNTVELPGTPNSAPTWENDLIGVQDLIPFDHQVTVFYGHAIDPDLPITYHIYYSKTSPIDFATASQVTTTNESPKVVTGLDNFVPYFFAVRAEDSLGIMEQNAVELSTIPNPGPIWDTTIGIQTLDAQNQSLIAYYGTAHDIDSPVSYRVYYSETSPINFATALHIDDPGGSPTTIPGLDNGKLYFAAVRAFDVYGNEDTNTITLSNTPTALPTEIWSVFTGGVVQGSPMLADLNGDTVLDVICGDQANKMVVYDGTDGSVIWTFPTAGWVDSTAALADMNGDTVPDIIFGSFDKNVYCVNGATGSEIWHATTGGAVVSTPTLANIKGDFHLDVIVGSMDGKVYAFNGVDGALEWQFPTGAGVFSSPANGDLNGDGIPDIVVGSRDGKVYAIDGSTAGEIWSFNVGDWVNSSPALTDLNGDTVLDAVVAGLDGNVYALNGVDGSAIWTFPTGSYIWTSPSLARINGDSVPDVVLGADSSDIYAINGATGAQLWAYPSNDRIWSSAALADLNGDLVPDAVVGSDDGNLYCVDGATGELMFAFPTGDWIDSSPVVGDVDGDGIIDIALGRYDGYLTLLESAGAAVGLSPWPMFRRDWSHTARF
jgi:outer membrane protein assembly factor BamB